MLTTYPNSFKAGLVFQEIKGPFTVLSDIMSLLSQVGMIGYPLKQTTINWYETILGAGAGKLTFTWSSTAFVFMILVFNAYVKHRKRRFIITKDCAGVGIGMFRQRHLG